MMYLVMGSVGKGSGLYKIDQSNNLLTPDKNPTKFAQKLFDRNYQEARIIMRREIPGRESEVYGWNGLENDSDNKSASVRDLRGMQHLLNKEIKQVELDKNLGVITSERYNVLARSLDMVQKTLNKVYKRRKQEGFYK